MADIAFRGRTIAGTDPIDHHLTEIQDIFRGRPCFRNLRALPWHTLLCLSSLDTFKTTAPWLNYAFTSGAEAVI